MKARILLTGIVLVMVAAVRADDWPQWRGEKRDGVWRELGVIEKFPAGGPKVSWRAPVGGGYAGPAVSGGMVFVMDLVKGEGGKSDAEQVVCLNEADGRRLWASGYACKYSISYGNGPRVTPVVDGERLYALGAQGNLRCLAVGTGQVVWEKNVAAEGKELPAWGFAAHTLIDGNKLIVLTNDSKGIVLALNKETGEQLWKSLPAREPGYSAPMIYEFGGVKQLIVWHPESVNGLDPETGNILWTQAFGPVKYDVSIVAPTKMGEELFVTSFWDGGLMLRPGKDSVKVIWKKAGTPPKKTEALHSLMSSPFYRDGFIYGVCAGGQLRCIDATNAETKWETMAATTRGEPIANATAFLVPNGDRVFIASETGDLIIARLTPKGYEELDRAPILEPTQKDGKRKVLWSHPAFAGKAMFWRNDKEIVRVDLAKPN